MRKVFANVKKKGHLVVNIEGMGAFAITHIGKKFKGGKDIKTKGVGGQAEDGGRDWWSDIRLKTNINSIGQSPSGINIYEWNYVWDNQKRFRGAMAQELLKSHPHAVGMKKGFYFVDYNKIDVDCKPVG